MHAILLHSHYWRLAGLEQPLSTVLHTAAIVTSSINVAASFADRFNYSNRSSLSGYLSELFPLFYGKFELINIIENMIDPRL